MQDLTVEIDKMFLNIRVAAVIKADDKLLVSKWNNDRISLIGGRVKIGESTQEALVREVAEETGLKVVAAQLHAVVENFFKIDEKAFHEFLYVYDVETANLQLKTSAADFNCQQTLWLPLDKAGKLRPEVLEQVVKDEGHQIFHVVNREK